MKTIGLIGGMSWESSKLYYELINERVKEKLGGLHSAKSLMYSFDFDTIKNLQFEGKWDEAGDLLAGAAQTLERGGADMVVLCTNTMHLLTDRIEESITIPFIHIADPTAEKINRDGLRKIGLLGTMFTMKEDFYKGRLQSKHGIEVILPEDEEMDAVHSIIYDELCRGIIRDESRDIYLAIIENLKQKGAEGIILGCTEVGMLVKQEHADLPLYDTTELHAITAADLAMNRISEISALAK